MENKDFTCVILAAGQGTRMKSQMPKVLHRVCGLALVEHVIAACRNIGEPVVIIGNGSEQVKQLLGDSVTYVYNLDGTVKSMTDRRRMGISTVYTFDRCRHQDRSFDRNSI